VLNLDLHSQVQDSGVVERPDLVRVVGPPNWLLVVRISRPSPGWGPERADVTQRPWQLTSESELLPAGWFEPGDYVQVERTQPFEPRPSAPAADRRPGWLGGEPGTGMGDFIARGG
jgi:hypothetical protein